MLTLTQSRPTRYFAFFYLYIMQGLPSGFALIAVTNYLAAEGLTPKAIASFGAVVGLPWSVKFLWGPLVDRFQGWAMGRRRPWVLGAQIGAFLASLGVLMTTDPVAGFDRLLWSFVVHGVFASLQDVSVDAMAITVTPEAERGRVNALMKIGMATGQAIGGAGLAYLLRNGGASPGGFQTAALVQSAVLGGFTLITLLLREEPTDARFSLRYVPGATVPVVSQSFGPLVRELGRGLLAPQAALLFVAVAVVFIGERLFQRTYYLHLIQKLGWTDTSVSVISGTWGTLLAVSVALAGGFLSDRIGARRLLLGVGLGMAALHVGYGLLGAFWANATVATTALVVQKTLEPLFSIAALPALMALCRPGVAGAQFAVYMALGNQADVLGIYLSGQLVNRFPAPLIAIGCGLAMLAATALIGVVVRWEGRTIRPEIA